MNDAGLSTESTITSVISQLFDQVMALENKVYGERPDDAMKNPEPTDRITKNRNDLLKLVERLKTLNNSLNII